MRHGEILPETQIDRAQRTGDVTRAEQRHGEPMDFLPDGIVFLAEVDDLAQFRFQLLALFAQADDLAFADRNRSPAVRVRNVDLSQHVGILLEELGVRLQIIRDVFRFHFSPCPTSSVRHRILLLPVLSSSPVFLRRPRLS
ncbi:hypothetical protein D3C83_25630 [compost metagenome]